MRSAYAGPMNDEDTPELSEDEVRDLITNWTQRLEPFKRAVIRPIDSHYWRLSWWNADTKDEDECVVYPGVVEVVATGSSRDEAWAAVCDKLGEAIAGKLPELGPKDTIVLGRDIRVEYDLADGVHYAGALARAGYATRDEAGRFVGRTIEILRSRRDA